MFIHTTRAYQEAISKIMHRSLSTSKIQKDTCKTYQEAMFIHTLRAYKQAKSRNIHIRPTKR